MRLLRTTVTGAPASSAPPVVFLHGWPDDARVFHPLLPAFDKFRCVSIDLPRCDREPWEDADLGFESLATLTASTIERERRPVVLIAHDWGAFIASLVLTRRPELVERVVLLDVGAQPASFVTPARPKLLFVGAGIVAYQAVNALIYLLGRIHLLTVLADWLNALWIPRLCSLANTAEQMALVPLLRDTVPNLLVPRRWHAEDYGRPTSSAINYFYLKAFSFFPSKSYRQMHATLNAPPVPLLFLYGSGSFHDALWEAKLSSPEWPMCDAAFIECGHWFFRRPSGAARTSEAIIRWMDRTGGSPDDSK